MNPDRHTFVRCVGGYISRLDHDQRRDKKVDSLHRLLATIPAPRMAPYERACVGTSVAPIDLYRWSNAVALAMFDDLSTLEVAMRSKMAQELVVTYGSEWYRNNELLDDGTLKLIRQAWTVGRIHRLTGSLDVIHGKLVATLMFGFWVKLLGRGAQNSAGAQSERRIYDTLLWKAALRNAFPNVGPLERARVETAARQVQALRNRIAHHEHIIWGVPMPGEHRSNDSVVRLPVHEIHEALLSLAGYIDLDLELWLRQHSQVNDQLMKCPLPTTADLFL